MTTYNPYPVYNSSAAWVALEQLNTGAGLIAQVGWAHQYGVSNNELVFVQWTDNKGNPSDVYTYNIPSSSETYYTYRQSNGTFDLEWNEGYKLPPSNVNWGSDTAAYAGEVLSYNDGQGDHFPGNATTPVVFSNLQWSDQNGGRHSPNLYYYAGNGNYNHTNAPTYGYLYNWGSSEFEVWDSRCY